MKPRPGRLTGEDLTALRLACFLRDKGRCSLCGVPLHYVALFAGDPDAYDMAHRRSRGAGGADELANVHSLCHADHMLEHRGDKPCPSKRLSH